MSSYDTRPWLSLYDSDIPADIAPEHDTALEMFRGALRRSPNAPVVKYFDGTITMTELDRLSDAFAAGLAEQGFHQSDRLALFLQNVPQFMIATVGTWKAGGVVVPVNPMYRERELHTILLDSGAKGIVCPEHNADVIAASREKTSVAFVMTTSELEYQTRHDPRLFDGVERSRPAGTLDMAEVLSRHEGKVPPDPDLGADDIAFLPYTSGTTGPPKGSMNTHANVVFNAQVYRDWMRIGPGDGIFGVAPLFHITGLIGHVALALLCPAPLILTHRFEPTVAAEAVREHRATFTIGAITVFIAWTNTTTVTREHLACLRSVYSGGAPLPRAAIEAFREKFGHYIRNGYGLTETNSPSHAVPSGRHAPVDPDSGAVSVGVPVPNTIVRIVDDSDADVAVGQVGEIVTEGPQVAAGYWDKPDETARAMPGGRFHTGDVGFMDEHGWFYIVDRKKDQINAAGYKVWPREVEDVLYEHPAVREAAVIGVPDAYRGETVKAFVSLKAGSSSTEEELIALCKEKLAAYKYPRLVELLDELPKTVTGKILRRELRRPS
ncbi:long-chain acyl-CoA synthetase [Halopolyspora algeriensis]|uniref:Long-chain acyl-CoA synthetase n=1 Tax=Halopolyspora algeriensis TaxID=1500506 RepID=A0A368VKX9_9ACTN|nr:AMP-binding protein [Halopolyspora algeriensis]RCW39651.1 long-chain acyl-CoA synthetase [Halopolyspora algeriensis]TQM54056.1 long-chain acyl-CoA synthetase [Halopolyspora algeriensis]